MIFLACGAAKWPKNGKLERSNTRVQSRGEDLTECHAYSEPLSSSNSTLQGESLRQDKEGLDQIEQWPLIWPGRHLDDNDQVS